MVSGSGVREIEQVLRRLDVTAAQVQHAGRIVIQVGDVSRPVHIHSIRKSIISALFGQAHDRGEIHLRATLGELGIDDTPHLTDEEKSATIEDLLTARSGVYLPTDDDAPLAHPPRGSHPPGTFWCYNNWDFNVLGNIYERLTARSLFIAFGHDLARPLGMTDWDMYRHGTYQYRADVLGGTPRYPNYTFHMSARDIGRIGQLYLGTGLCNGRQLLSPEWIARSTGALSRTSHQPGLLGMYGYCWWVTGPSAESGRIGIVDGTYSAVGFGGNFLTILPALDTVVTVMTETVFPIAGSPALVSEPKMTNDRYQELLARLATVLS